MRIYLFFIGMICSAAGIFSCNQHPANQKDAANDSNAARFKQHSRNAVSATLEGDARFAVDAAGSGMAAVELGTTASDRALEKPVRQLGDSMAHNYSNATAALKRIAETKKISLPAAPADGNRLREMRALKGRAFDDRYLKQVKQMHSDDIELFKRYISAGKDSDLLHWAILRLPVLEQGLEYVKQVDSLVAQQRRTY
ncbi:DUF4142 domain-containing protein [Niabella sp.]|uniref:DUF4142 domain-containing protein n=1 Tax=Niabella sp. TaxID=1962976 RepID=UPI00260DBECB|nr:DUF4142 domain-containing protein [Niabella sp.]